MDHYDTLPYESIPFPDTHPTALNMLGRLFGIDAASATRCRVLELGCATGGNLIPMAWHLRGSEFVGIDLSAGQIDTGNAIIGELGLENVRLVQADIRQLDNSFGQFDYIIAHGVLSWVPSDVQQALFRLFQHRLGPEGIGYISFNVSPGWHARSALRDMLLYHTRDLEDPVTRLNRARDFLGLLKEIYASNDTPAAQALLAEIHSLDDAHPSYLFHEYLETNNRSFTFDEFRRQLTEHGLRYLCDSRLHTMFGSNISTTGEHFLDTVDSDIAHEQYLDFFSQRTFRQSLVVHEQIEPNFEIDLELLDHLHCASDLRPQSSTDQGDNEKAIFHTANGKPVEVGDPLAAAMLRILYQCFPSTVPMAQLAAEVIAKHADAEERDAWRTEIFSLFANNLVILTSEPHRFDSPQHELPQTGRLAQVLLGFAWQHIPTVWHHSLDIDDFTRCLLSHLDGKQDQAALLTCLGDDVQSGKLQLPIAGTDNEQLQELLALNTSRLLEIFARNGILD
ncbi:methyltransferase regulatory domain-containing protein [Thiosocius teredinicola]|uniref:methyltransferase regulatory domain-containing protein n=1 Tax=Thiosocius teredinicola TaxID=1973002 RepID=UPI000990A4DA